MLSAEKSSHEGRLWRHECMSPIKAAKPEFGSQGGCSSSMCLTKLHSN